MGKCGPRDRNILFPSRQHKTKITPTESQSVLLLITFSRPCLLISSDTSAWSSLIGTFFGVRIGTGNTRHPKEFEQRNPKESVRLGREAKSWPTCSLRITWACWASGSQPHRHEICTFCSIYSMKDQNSRIKTMSKTFIESSKFRSNIGTTLF